MIKSLILLGLAIVFIISGCQLTQMKQEEADAYGMSNEAFSYLSTGFNFIQSSAVEKESIDWNILRESVFNQARGSSETMDTYPALRMVLNSLDDQHSYLHTSRHIQRNRETVSLPKSESLPRGISILTIPTHVDQSVESSRDYISTAQRLIREGENSCGWIIDLRGNRGGNQGPMIVSLAPFLPPELDSYAWSPENGVRYLYQNSFAEHSSYSNLFRISKRFPLFLKDIPVAVLVDGDTGSSGEAVLLQFIGRPSTKIIGTRTSGASSNIRILTMSDGAMLGVADSYFADRLGEIYKNGIAPDIDTGERDAIDAAITWLGTLDQCTGA